MIFLADGGIICVQQDLLASLVAVLADGNIADGDIAGDLITAVYSDDTFCVADATHPVRGRQFVLVSSPKGDRYKELLKQPNVYMLCMPTWGATELANLWKLRFPSLDESVWRGYYDKWGGVPRSVLEKSDSQDQQILEQRSNNVDIDSCMRWIGTDRYNTTEVSGIVLHLTATPEGKYIDFRVRFASLYVEKKVLHHFSEKGMQQMITKYIRECEDTVFASAKVFLFEAVAHRILAGGGEFDVCLTLPPHS